MSAANSQKTFITSPQVVYQWKDEKGAAKLEVVNAKLVSALKYAVRIYGRFGAVVNEPYHPGEWITEAKEALRSAGVKLEEDDHETP